MLRAFFRARSPGLYDRYQTHFVPLYRVVLKFIFPKQRIKHYAAYLRAQNHICWLNIAIPLRHQEINLKMSIFMRLRLILLSAVFEIIPFLFLCAVVSEQQRQVNLHGVSEFTSLFSYFLAIFISFIALIMFELGLTGLVGLEAEQKAPLFQELIFEAPCVIWVGFVIQQLFEYFTHTVQPYPATSYLLVLVALFLIGLIYKARLVAWGVLPPASPQGGRRQIDTQSSSQIIEPKKFQQRTRW